MALIKCPECGKEVSSGAASCPNCGHPISGQTLLVKKEKKKGSCLGRIVGFIVFFILVGVGIGALSDGESDYPKKVGTIKSKETESTEEKTKDIFDIGEIAEYHDIQVCVLGYETSNGNQFSSPEKGNEFVFLNVEIANNSEKELTVSSLMSFEAYCDDYKLNFSSGALMAMDSRTQLDGTIDSGKKLKGYIGFEVPTDWKTVELQFVDSIWSNNKFKFKIAK